MARTRRRRGRRPVRDALPAIDVGVVVRRRPSAVRCGPGDSQPGHPLHRPELSPALGNGRVDRSDAGLVVLDRHACVRGVADRGAHPRCGRDGGLRASGLPRSLALRRAAGDFRLDRVSLALPPSDDRRPRIQQRAALHGRARLEPYGRIRPRGNLPAPSGRVRVRTDAALLPARRRGHALERDLRGLSRRVCDSVRALASPPRPRRRGRGPRHRLRRTSSRFGKV